MTPTKQDPPDNTPTANPKGEKGGLGGMRDSRLYPLDLLLLLALILSITLYAAAIISALAYCIQGCAGGGGGP